MSNLRAQFEDELKQKLSQKSTAFVSDETVLQRAFKYFDLDNSGFVTFEEWTKAIEKIGVMLPENLQLRRLFQDYDLDGSGELDYTEFSAMIFGADSQSGKRLSPKKGLQPREYQEAEQVLLRLREKLALRGGRGIMGLARQFKIMDDDESKQLEFPEFVKAMRDFRVDLTDGEMQLLFNYVDRDSSGAVDYDEFLRSLRGPMNQFRRNLVARAFQKLDIDGSGQIDLDEVRQLYDPRNHPDVRSGKKTEDDVLGEFLETFEMHRNINGIRDRIVTQDEFEEYYNNISASIDNDQYFELMMNNSWKLNQAPAYTKNKAWANEDAQRPTSNAIQRPNRVQVRSQPKSKQEPLGIFEKFRAQLARRGGRGIIGIQRQFKIMDDDNSKTISLGELRKGCRDFQINLSDEEVRELFNSLDRDGGGFIDYDELIRGIRGPMNNFRRNLVTLAWNKLDRDNSGIIDISDLRGVYIPDNHPDVVSGRKTPDDVLGEFLETFEMHHNISDLSRRDRKVTWEEFEEYYTNISASIDNDQYFELMMNNAWQLQGRPISKQAWAGDVGQTSPPRRGVNWSADHHKKLPPYGISNDQVDYSRKGCRFAPQQQPQVAAGQPSWPGSSQIYQTNGGSGTNAQNVEQALALLREKLRSRGGRGFIGMSRQFKIMDDSGDKRLDFDEFAKAIRDFRVDLDPSMVQSLFNYFDADRSGLVDYEEFVHKLRGEMNEYRISLVRQAYRKLDKNGDGSLEIDDIKDVYDASRHPDVRSGKKTEDEILCDFLDTFEVHHSLYKEDTRDFKVTFDEFLEYYKHISASVDDDRYFELMMKNAWNFEGRKYGKGWSGEV